MPATHSSSEFELELLQDSESIVKYLYALAEGIKRGQIVLGSKKKQILFEPHGLIKFKVKAKKKMDASKIVIKMNWDDAIRNNPITKTLIIEQGA